MGVIGGGEQQERPMQGAFTARWRELKVFLSEEGGGEVLEMPGVPGVLWAAEEKPLARLGY